MNLRRSVTILAILAIAGLFAVCRKPGIPPDKPAITSGPEHGGINTSCEFAATTTHPDDEPVAIRFDWDNKVSDWSVFFPSGDTVRMSNTWTNPGTYGVKAQAKVEAGAESEWSDPHSVVITTNQPPNTPAVPTGPAAAPKDSVCTFTVTATDPDGDSISYRFDWGDGDTSEWTDWVPSGQPGSASHAWRRGGVFSVRAQARDVKDALSQWSNPHRIAIPNLPPDTPSTPTGSSEGYRDTSYSFSSSATDPDGDSVSIRFDWGNGDTSYWSSFVPSGQTITMSHAWRDFGDYLVRTQARDTDGATSAWSVAWSIAIRLKWRYQTGGYVNSSPAIAADGTIYVGAAWPDNHLYALNPDGTLIWRYRTGNEVRSSPAIAADGTVYVGSYDGYLYAINPDGTLKWRYETRGGVWSSPAIAADGTVHVGSDLPDNHLYALNPDGTLKWRYQAGSGINSSPAIAADGTIYVGAAWPDNHLYALNPDGTLKWRYRTDFEVRSSPAIAADGTVYVGSDDLYALNPDGTLKWQYQTPVSVPSSPAIAGDGTVYFGADGLYALNPDGTLRWRYRTGAWVTSSPAIAADGTVCFGYDCIYAINPDGTLKWRYGIDAMVGSSPAIGADGTVYVGWSSDNYLYAFGGDSPLADSPWPKFRHDSRNTGRVGGGR